MFEASGLMVFYENMLALNNVSLRCDQNQIIGVFGANSAGKSTLMYTLSGIMLDIQRKRRWREVRESPSGAKSPSKGRRSWLGNPRTVHGRG